jgi:hypothetical protein
MHRSSGAAAREIVLKRLQNFRHLTMFEEKKRHTGRENENQDDVVEVSHASKRIIDWAGSSLTMFSGNQRT